MTTATRKKKTNGRASQKEFPGMKKRIPSIDKAAKELQDANDELTRAKKDQEDKADKLLGLMKRHKKKTYTTADNFEVTRKPGSAEKVSVKARKVDKEIAATNGNGNGKN